MKFSVGIAVLIAVTATPSLSQQGSPASVPLAVRQSYRTHFPGTRPTEWKRKADRSFEAEFKLKGVDIAAKFDSAGTWLETETTITRSALPPAVRDALGRDFPRYRVIETQRLDRPLQPEMLWEIHLANRQEIVKAQYDSEGSLRTKSAKPKKPVTRET